MKKLFLVMMATFLIVATNAIAAGTPGVNNVLSAQQRTETWWDYFGGQKVIFYMHEVKLELTRSLLKMAWKPKPHMMAISTSNRRERE